MERKPMLPLIFLCFYVKATNSFKAIPSSNFCGCTTETLPHPRIVLLGPTGVGKSTFGNRLLGITEVNDKEAICSQNGLERPIKFGVGHRSESHTIVTSWIVGHYLGDPSNPCITIIDSPGTGDTEGRDCDHGIALAEGIKEIGSIDAFMLLFKGTNPRFSISMQEQIHLYTNIFGLDMFKNSITEFTYWSHDRRSVRRREKTRDGLNEEIQHQTWNKEYGERLQVPRKIPTVFVDPVFDEEIADEREVEKFGEYTDKLWKLLTNEFEPFTCDKRCKAPSGFFSGQPWLHAENAVQNKRPEDRVSITWQIWFAGCDGSGTKSYKIYFKAQNDKTATEIFESVVDDDDKVTVNEANLLKKMTVTDEPADKYKTIRLTISSVEEAHFGEYFVENEKGRSNISKLIKIIDGKWAHWGSYGNCSKTCITGDEKPGNMERLRECIPPQNGGLECKGERKQIKTCAHRHGDSSETFRQCPVDATWSNWVSGWTNCSPNCITVGETLPQQSRSRVCQPERYGGKNCTWLEDQTTQNNSATYSQKRNCTSLPACPKPASLGPWTEWSPCSATCYNESDTVPQSTRRRTCKNATLSSNGELNDDILRCKDLGDMEVFRNCKIPACPVPGRWIEWAEWSTCSTSCERGSRHRSRAYIEGRNGAALKPKGIAKEKEDCNQNKKCPVPAIWTWGNWSACDIGCYRPDGYRGLRTRTQNCKEGDPSHDTLNCKYPPAPGITDTQRPCPGLSACSSLTRVYADIHEDSRSGTDASVFLTLRNGGSGESCETKVLDSSGNSWATGYSEDFKGGEELSPCSNFYPSSKYGLEFNFRLASSDGMQLKHVHLEFGSKVYKWDGASWFNKDITNWRTIHLA